MVEFLHSLEELTWQNKLIISILLLLSVYFWYLGSQPGLVAFADYYLKGCLVGIAFYAAHVITKGEWVDVTILWMKRAWPIYIKVIILIGYLWFFLFLPLSTTQQVAPEGLIAVDSKQPIMLGVPVLGSTPIDSNETSLAGMTIEGRLTMASAGAIESIDWLLLFSTLVLVTVNLFFLLFVPSRLNILAKEYLRTPRTYVEKYYNQGTSIEKFQVIAILMIVVISMGIISGWIVSSWHMANYNQMCSTKGLSAEQCSSIFKRAELFGISGNWLSYLTGSGFIAITAHFINNLVASY